MRNDEVAAVPQEAIFPSKPVPAIAMKAAEPLRATLQSTDPSVETDGRVPE